MTTNMQTLDELAAAREQEHAAAADLRAGGPAYRAALAPDIAAARERVAGLQALVAAGAVTTLQAALPLFQHRAAFDVSRNARKIAAEARGAIMTALVWLSGGEGLIQRVENPGTADLATWVPAVFIRVQRDVLLRIVEPRSVQAILDQIPGWTEALRASLHAPMDYRAGVVIAHRPVEQERAVSALDAWGDSGAA